MRDAGRHVAIPFDALNLERALTYHLVYHHSLLIRVNHLILLPTYLLGVFLCCSANPYLLSAAFTVLSLHSTKLSLRYGLVFIVVVLLPLSGIALVLHSSTLLTSVAASLPLLSGGTAIAPSLVAGCAVVLSSLLLQLAGHAIFEDLQATPNLVHGLILAPFLECTVAVMWCSSGGRQSGEDVLEEAKRIRAHLKTQCARA